MNGDGNQQEAMRDLASLLWNRFLRERVLEELSHEVNAFRAEVVTNNRDGTLTVRRPFEENDLTLRAAASLGGAEQGDQVLILGIGDKRRALSNAFVLCKTDLSTFASEATVLAAFPTDTASGFPANFPDGADGVPVVDLSVAINPVQEGSGDPTPSNVRPISGWTGLTLYQSGADTSDPKELAVSWEDEAGTVYGGTLDMTTGVLTVTRRIVDFGNLTWNKGQNTNISWVSISSGPLAAMKRPASNSVPVDAICSEYTVIAASATKTNYQIYCNVTSGSAYFGLYNTNFAALTTSEIQTALTGVKIVFALKTPVTYQLTPKQVRTLLGENNLWADTGDVTVEYRADPTLYIQKKLGA